MRSSVWLAAAVVGCAGGDPDRSDVVDTAATDTAPAPAVASNRLGLVFADFGFAYGSGADDLTVDGIDLDATVSTVAGGGPCPHDDLAGEVVEGVDHQFLRVIHDIGEGLGERQIMDGVIEAAVKNGSFALLIEVTEVDDPRDDDAVTVQIFESLDPPPLGGGEVLAGGSLTVNAPVTTPAAAGTITDGTLVAGPFTFSMPLEIQVVSATLTLRDAWLRLDLDGDDASGVIGGYWAVQDAVDILGVPTQENSPNADDPSQPGAAGFALDDFVASLEAHADGHPEQGACTTISAAFVVDARQAFVFR